MNAMNWKLGETIQVLQDGVWTSWTIRESVVDGLNIADPDGKVRWVPEAELRKQFARREMRRQKSLESTSDPLRRMLGASLCSFSEEERAQVRALAPYVVEFNRRGLRAHASQPVLRKLIADVAADRGDARPPCWRTLSDKLRKLREPGMDGRVLLPKRSLQGNRTGRFKAFEKELDDVIRAEVLKPVPMKVVDLWSLLQARLEAFNLTVPEAERVEFVLSKRTIERRIAELPVGDKLAAWNGKSAARRRCLPTAKAPSATFPMEAVEIDHTLADIVVVHPRTRKPLTRPVMTVMLDRYSRMVVGATLGFEPPGYAAVMRCMRQAILPKDALLERYGLPAEGWPCWGALHCIVVDNGPEFHAAAFDDTCSQLLIDRRYCRTGTPGDKGEVERFIGTVNRGFFHSLPGTKFSGPEERGEYDSEKAACIDLAELRALFYSWLVCEYFPSHHRGIDTSPLARFREGIASHPLVMPCEPEDVDVLLLPGEPRTLQRQGVAMHGTWYGAGHRELARLLNDPHRPAKCVVKEDPDDLGRIYLLDWTCGRYIELECLPESGLDGVTKREWAVDSEMARRARADGQRVTHLEVRDRRVARVLKTKELEAAGKIRGAAAARVSRADPEAPGGARPPAAAAPVAANTNRAVPTYRRTAVASLEALGISLKRVRQ
jgi:putative transposase